MRSAFEAALRFFFPELEGELPYELVEEPDCLAALRRLDRHIRVVNARLEGAAKPMAVLSYRGNSREPIIMMHGSEFLRLIQKAEFGAV